MDRKKEIIKIINSISGKYPPHEVFSDWVRCSAFAISNACCLIHDRVWEDREKAYLDTAGKYSRPEVMQFAEMLALLTEELEDDMSDVLGRIYMESGMGSKAAGQFFTPYHVSRLCAEIAVPKPDEDGIYRISEPACGGGGMVIAVAETLKNRGVNYQRCMEVVAQDLDWKGVYMCYLQLSLLGIKAVCVQGDALALPYTKGKTEPDRVLYTPAKMGVLI